MNVRKITLSFFIGLSLVVTGCHSSQQLMEPKLSLKNFQHEQPEFLNDIAISSNPISIKMNTIEGLKNRKETKFSVANVLQIKYANILGVVPQSITNFSLYNFIDDWYGVRYRFGGSEKSGIDCSAFVQRLYENVFCKSLVRTAIQQFSTCKIVFKSDSLKEGDLVFFKTAGRRISHVGIYLMNNFFVHASSSQGVMISSLDDDYWERHYAGAGQIPKEENRF